MSKKVTTISIDEDILRMAKKELPNLSVFVEDCLKAYLGWNNTQVKSIDENLQIIQNALVGIQIASSKDHDVTVNEEYTTEQQKNIWSRLFGGWRTGNLVTPELENASKILNVTVRELKELFEILEYDISKEDLVKYNDWEFVKKTYLK